MLKKTIFHSKFSVCIDKSAMRKIRVAIPAVKPPVQKLTAKDWKNRLMDLMKTQAPGWTVTKVQMDKGNPVVSITRQAHVSEHKSMAITDLAVRLTSDMNDEAISYKLNKITNLAGLMECSGVTGVKFLNIYKNF